MRVISVRMDYLPQQNDADWREHETRRLSDPEAAVVSVYARGRDYHKVLRQRLDDGMHSVRDAAVRAAQEAAHQAKDAARAADRYAHDEPWRVAGAALAVGALVGFLLARR